MDLSSENSNLSKILIRDAKTAKCVGMNEQGRDLVHGVRCISCSCRTQRQMRLPVLRLLLATIADLLPKELVHRFKHYFTLHQDPASDGIMRMRKQLRVLWIRIQRDLMLAETSKQPE